MTRAFIAQIERVNPEVNAIVTFLPEAAIKAAKAMDRTKGDRGILAGLPIAFKDLVPTKGVRNDVRLTDLRAQRAAGRSRSSSRGSRPQARSLIGKTNTPEFGAGSQTFNKVFGATRNPYDLAQDLRRLVGRRGRGGGVRHAALRRRLRPRGEPAQSRQLLQRRRLPAHARARPGVARRERVEHALGAGPDGAHVADCALLFGAMAGPDPRAPTSISEPGTRFPRLAAERFPEGPRRVEPRSRRAADGSARDRRPRTPARRSFASLGCIVEEAEPDFSGATEAFETLRALAFLQNHGALYREHRDKLKDTVLWNIEQGLALTRREDRAGRELCAPELFHRMRRFLERYDFLLCPVNQLPPYPVDEEWPREIAGVRMENYLDWMKSCYYITITSHPAISVPAGFTSDDPALPGRPANRRTLPGRSRRAAARARLRGGHGDSGSAGRPCAA